MKVYIVLNEDNMVFASEDGELTEAVCDAFNNDGISEEVEESGRDIDDLTDTELAEYAFTNGFNGGYHKCVTVDIPVSNVSELDNNFTEIEIDNDVVVTYNEILEKLLESSDDSEDGNFEDDDYTDEDDDFTWDSIE